MAVGVSRWVSKTSFPLKRLSANIPMPMKQGITKNIVTNHAMKIPNLSPLKIIIKINGTNKIVIIAIKDIGPPKS